MFFGLPGPPSQLLLIDQSGLGFYGVCVRGSRERTVPRIVMTLFSDARLGEILDALVALTTESEIAEFKTN